MAKINQRHLLSYLGGVFDGEGCVAIHKNGNQHLGHPGYTARITVAMADGIIPMLFRNTFGGTLRKRTKQKEHWKTIYWWTIGGLNSLPALKDLLPFVIIKRPQIEVAIHLLETMRRSGSKGLSDEESALREVDYILSRELKKQPLSPTLEGQDIE